MGAGAFTRPRGPSTANARANAEALRIARGIGGPIGIRAECLGTGRTAEANADHVAVAASTLKVAILAAALAQDPEDPTRAQVYGTYRDAIVRSSNDAANRVLATVGDGSRAVGTRRVNTLMARLQMRSSFLDGPYRISGGASLKRTSALDLERLARAVYLAADGAGPLARLGVSRHETRVLIGLMAGENNPGLIRDHVPGPVAHKAGWLGGVQNDVALVFGTPGGTCLVGITTEHLAYAAAAAVGRDVADRVLPLLAARQPRSRSHAAPAGPAAATTSSSGRRPGPTRTSGSGGVPWGWIVAGAGMLVLAAGVATRCATTWRRQAELSDQKPNDGRR
jgi:beta-lactamase class A